MSAIWTNFVPVRPANSGAPLSRMAPPTAATNPAEFDTPQDGVTLSSHSTDFSAPTRAVGTMARTAGIGVALAAAGVGLIWGVWNTEHIGPQESGVIYNRVTGEVQNLDAKGSIYPLIDYNPFRQDIHSVPSTPQTIADGRLHGIEIRTSDPVDTTADFVVNYKITNPADLIRYYSTPADANEAVYSAFREVARTESGSFSLTDLQGVKTAGQHEGDAQRIRNEAIQKLLDAVNAKLDRQVKESWGEKATAPIRVVTVNMRDVATPQAVRAERDKAAQAALAQETAALELKAAQTRAQTDAAHITAEADARLTAAKAESERLAELEKAYGNLSPTTLQAMQIDALKEIARSGKATIIVDGSGHGVTLTQPAN